MIAERQPFRPPQVSPELDIGYRSALQKEQRWKNAATPTSKDESDLDHIDSSFALIDEVELNYRRLAKVLDMNAVREMEYVHEMGEIIVHDLARSDPNYDILKPLHKKREQRAGYHLIGRFIKDLQIRKKAHAVYQRYVNYRLDDKEALFVHLIDKIQAVRFGMEHVYNNPTVDKEKREAHALLSVDLIFEFATPLLSLLSRDAKTDLAAFIQVETTGYSRIGFQQFTDEARRKLFKTAP